MHVISKRRLREFWVMHPDAERPLRKWFKTATAAEWTTFGQHLDFITRQGHAQNLAWFVGHNAVRYAAGVFGTQATEQELRAMEDFVREAMHAGALGLSTGLEFNPGRAAPTEELVRLNKVVGEYDGYYTSHIRNRDA